MKKIILILFLPFIIIGCSKSTSDNAAGYVTAYEGYQLLKEYMHKDNFDTSCVNLISVSSAVDNIIFSGNDMGKSDYWSYIINYNQNENNEEKYYICYYHNNDESEHGFSIEALDKNEDKYNFKAYGLILDEPFKYILLTKQNDSPVFVEKLIRESNFLKILKDEKNKESYFDESFIQFSYLSQDEENLRENNIKIQDNTPYWRMCLFGYIEIADYSWFQKRNTWILLADEKINKNVLKYSATKFYTAYEGYQFVKAYLERRGYDTNYLNLLSVSSDLLDVFYTGDNLGKSSAWNYRISYNKNNDILYIDCYYFSKHFLRDSYSYQHGQAEILFYQYSEINWELPTKFINLTKENDSPKFFEKFTPSIFLETLKASLESYYDYPKEISLSFLTKDEVKFYDAQNWDDIPYWKAVINGPRDDNKTYYTDYILLPDNKEIKIVIEKNY